MTTNIETKDGTWYATASQVEQAAFREWVMGVLRMHTTEVEFVKTDGTLRKMSATLKPEVVVVTESKTGRTKKENIDVCSVWDIEAKGWRSFRFDKIKSISFSLG